MVGAAVKGELSSSFHHTFIQIDSSFYIVLAAILFETKES